MFPIPFNFPFRKNDGTVTTIGSAISEGGGGGGYTLPTASADTKGGVKIGAGLTMDGEVLRNTNPTPPTPYTLPIASAETLGGVKIGSGVSIDENGVISVSGGGGGGGGHCYLVKTTNPKIAEFLLFGAEEYTLNTASAVLNYLNANGNMGVVLNGSDANVMYTRVGRYNNSNFSLVSKTFTVSEGSVVITNNSDEHLNASNVTISSATKIF